MTVQVGDRVIALRGSRAAHIIIHSELVGVVSSVSLEGFAEVIFNYEGEEVSQICLVDYLEIMSKKRTKFGGWINAIEARR